MGSFEYLNVPWKMENFWTGDFDRGKQIMQRDIIYYDTLTHCSAFARISVFVFL